MFRKIGILGGMGPQATALLMQKVIAATPAVDDADHVPLLVDQNPQIPSRIAHLVEGHGDSPGPVLASMAEGLVAAGAQALAMPCNTAHLFAPDILNRVSVPFIDMVALSAVEAFRRVGPGGRVGILGSPALRKIRLFDGSLSALGVSSVYPADGEALLHAIRQIKAHGPGQDAEMALRSASDDLLSQGAVVQILACTEFSLVAHATAPGADVIDTLDELVEGIIAFSQDGRPAPVPCQKTGMAAHRSGAAPLQKNTDQQGKEEAPC